MIIVDFDVAPIISLKTKSSRPYFQPMQILNYRTKYMTKCFRTFSCWLIISNRPQPLEKLSVQVRKFF